MKLYRGMSDVELSDWVENERSIPKEKYFTCCPEEAIGLGKFYLRSGNLIILQVQADDYFTAFHNTDSKGAGYWYENKNKISLDEIIFDILTPKEAMAYNVPLSVGKGSHL
ncbi:hypothetical protein HQ489_00220 [Candidatus Woesearchaeota archaeon]|nr:hypothetical protein [Candidatus Woesearchaeota archaeon]